MHFALFLVPAYFDLTRQKYFTISQPTNSLNDASEPDKICQLLDLEALEYCEMFGRAIAVSCRR